MTHCNAEAIKYHEQKTTTHETKQKIKLIDKNTAEENKNESDYCHENIHEILEIEMKIEQIKNLETNEENNNDDDEKCKYFLIFFINFCLINLFRFFSCYSKKNFQLCSSP